MTRIRFLLAILVLVSGLQAQAETTVFAAASLADVLDEIIATYAKHTGGKVIASYAGSSVLARQVEAGAPAHIFISADLDWMNYLARRGYVQTVPVVLAGNRLVLIAPADSPLSIAVGKGMNLATILGNERIAIADPESVPAGKYARAALEYFGEWQPLQGKLIPMDNVRAALIVVQRKEATLGIVYHTDAKASSKVKVIGVFPEESHAPIVYPAALVEENRNAEGEAFLAYLRGNKAGAIFTRHGFQVTPRTAQ